VEINFYRTYLESNVSSGYTHTHVREKNEFAKISKNLARYRSENNFIELSR